MNINELAQKNELGRLVQEFKVEFLWRNYTLCILLIIPLLFVILVAVRSLDLSTAFIAIFITFIIISSIFMLVFFANKNQQLLLYESGLIYINKNNIIVKYEDIQEIFQEIIIFYVNGIPTPTHYKYTINAINQPNSLYLTDIFQDIKQAGDFLQNTILQQKLPIVRDAYHRGENIPFGMLSIHQNGLTIKNELFPWSSIKNIRVVQGNVLLGKERGNLLFNIAVIPNIYVFLHLIYEIMAVVQPQTITPTKGKDIRIDLKISEAEIISGCVAKPISFSRWEICDECNGAGVDDRGHHCLVCMGEGQNQVMRTIQVAIPPESVSGDRLTMIGEGDAGHHGGSPGDVYVYLVFD